MPNTDPITREEMVAMFGSEMPIEAVDLLFNSPDTKTFGEIRAELRAIAAANPNPTSPSEGAKRQALIELIARGLFDQNAPHYSDFVDYKGKKAWQEFEQEATEILARHLVADAGVREAALEEALVNLLASFHVGDGLLAEEPRRTLTIPNTTNFWAAYDKAIRALQAGRGGG